MSTRLSTYVPLIALVGFGCTADTNAPATVICTSDKCDNIGQVVGESNVSITSYFNAPDCDAECQNDRLIRSEFDPARGELIDGSNGMREAIVAALDTAQQSLDFMIFGVDDEAIKAGLCRTADRLNTTSGEPNVRLVTDWRSLDPMDNRGDYPAVEDIFQCFADPPAFDPQTRMGFRDNDDDCVDINGRYDAATNTMIPAASTPQTFTIHTRGDAVLARFKQIRTATQQNAPSIRGIISISAGGAEVAKSAQASTPFVVARQDEDTDYTVTVTNTATTKLMGRLCFEDVVTEEEFSSGGIEFVHNNAIMHHKVYIIDAASDSPTLITGSTNQTKTDIERSHNHMYIMRGAKGFADAYTQEFNQLRSHCRANRTSTGKACTECTAACHKDVNAEGPFLLHDPNYGDITASVYFSPAPLDGLSEDDPLRMLRGPAAERTFLISKSSGRFCVKERRVWTSQRKDETTHECFSTRDAAQARLTELRMQPDPACNGYDANCVCHYTYAGNDNTLPVANGTNYYTCDYCGGPEGNDWGLIGSAESRILMSVFAATDACFGLGVARAATEGLETLAIFDHVNASSQYTRDEFMGAAGVPVYLSDWAACTGGYSRYFNHNKAVVIDNVLFDGSMNLSTSGSDTNNENTIIYQNKKMADEFAEYIRAEANLIDRRAMRRGVDGQRDISRLACLDHYDNDHDGLVDRQDADEWNDSCLVSVEDLLGCPDSDGATPASDEPPPL